MVSPQRSYPAFRRRPRSRGSRFAPALVSASLAATLALGLTACGGPEGPADGLGSSAYLSDEITSAPVRGSELPIDARPELLGRGDMSTYCPYLEGAWVENTNGQKLTGVGVDERFDPPACVFWSYEDVPQVQVMVRRMTSNQEAVSVVDHAAPIDSTLKALEPEGWSGGRRGGENGSGAVYAVWKDTTAVVVFTAQDQSVKAQQIAEQTIRNLNL